ncbi:MAG: L,D-transpeptidase [Candidatus Caenarcaniphilales bacterium]|nr:L,D-transpeptidase [Candidatus Caenarcaniphilales bacterium]
MFILVLWTAASANTTLPYPEIQINVPSRTLQLFSNGHLIKEYPVGVGNNKNYMTPPGDYKVDLKVLNPIWEHPYRAPGESRIKSGSKNPLGTRWIGFHSEGSGVYGIHGTNQPNSVGHFVSHGCVRMHNSDVEELFELVQIDTPVKVTYQRFEISVEGSSIRLEFYPDPYQLGAIDRSEVLNSLKAISPYIQIDYEILQRALSERSTEYIYEIATLIAPYQPIHSIQYQLQSPAPQNPSFPSYSSARSSYQFY